MHRRIDLGLVLCAFGRHDPALVVETSEFTRRRVVYSRCVRCSRTVPGTVPRQDETAPTRRSSLYT